MSLTREEELAALIAEQEQDMLYGDRLDYSRTVSLDAPLSHDPDAGTLAEIVGAEDVELEELIGAPETAVRLVRIRYKPVTRDEVASWRWAKFRRKWTQRQIVEYFGRSPKTVRYHLRKPWRRESDPMDYLESKLEFTTRAYQSGARLIDIATELHDDAGYSSPESCYQALRFLFVIHGVPRRPGRWKHGMRSQTATPEQTRQYRNEKNARLREAGLTTTRKPIRRCPGVTKAVRRCRRLAIDHSDFCMVHSAAKHPTQKWTRENVCEAMRQWERTHGHGPRTSEWDQAIDAHPSTGTVYSLFGSWPAAIREAGVAHPPRRVTKDENGRFIRDEAA